MTGAPHLFLFAPPLLSALPLLSRGAPSLLGRPTRTAALCLSWGALLCSAGAPYICLSALFLQGRPSSTGAHYLCWGALPLLGRLASAGASYLC